MDDINVALVGEDDVSPILAKIAETMQALADTMDEFNASAAEGTSVLSGLADDMDALANAVGMSDGELTDLDASLTRLADAAELFGEQLDWAGQQSGDLGEAITADASELAELGGDFADAAAQIVEFGNSEMGSADTAGELSDVIATLRDTMTQLVSVATGATEDINTLDATMLDGAAGTDRLAEASALARDALASISPAVEEVDALMDTLAVKGKLDADQLAYLGDVADSTFNAMTALVDTASAGFGELTAAVAANTDAFKANMMAVDEADLATESYTGKLGIATDASDEFSDSVRAGGESLTSNAMNLVFNAGLFDLFGEKALSGGMQFQTAMTLVSNLAATSEDNIANMTQELLHDAPIWGQTPAALANALYYVYSAGIHGATAIDVVQAAAYGASGGLGSMTQVAQTLTTILDDYHVPASQAAQVTGEFIDAVVAGKTTIEQFNQGLSTVIPSAAQAGYSVLDVTTALDALTRAGIPATRSGTYLRATLQTLGMESDTVATKAQAMGININGATLQFMAMNDHGNALELQLQYIENATNAAANAMGLTGAAKVAFFNNALMTLLGGIRSGTGAIAIGVDKFTEFNHILTQIESKPTTAAAHFDAMRNTITFATQQIGAAFATLSSRFVIAFGPQILAILKGVANAVAGLATLIGQHTTIAGVAVLGLGAALNIMAVIGLTGLIGKFTGISKILGVVSDLFFHGAGAADILEGAMSGIGGIFDTAKVALTALGAGFDMLLPELGGVGALFGALVGSALPVIAVIAGIALVVGILIMKWGNLIPALQPLNKGLNDLFGTTQKVKSSTEELVPVMENFHGHLIRVDEEVTKTTTSLKQVPGPLTPIKNGFDEITKAGQSVLGFFQSTPAHTEATSVAMTKVGDSTRVVGGHLMILHSQVAGIGVGMEGTAGHASGFSTVLQAIGRAAMVVWGFIQPLVQELGSQFVDVLKVVVQQIQGQLIPAWNSLKSGLVEAAPAFKIIAIAIGVVLAVAVGVLIGVLTGLIRAFGALISGAIQFGSGIVRAVVGAFQLMAGIVGGILAILGDIIHGHWAQIGVDAAKMWNNIKAGVVNIVGGLWQAVQGLFQATFGTIAGLVSGFVSGIIGFFSHLFHELVGGSIIPDLVKGALTYFTNLITQAPALIGKMVVQILASVGNLEIQFGAAILGLASKALAAISSLMTNIVAPVLAGESKMVSAGANLIMGIIHGIESAVGKAISAVTSAVGNIINAAKNAAHISSPSKDMVEIGGQMVEGMTVGITGKAHESATAMAAATKGVITSAQNGAKGIAGSGQFGGGIAGGPLSTGGLAGGTSNQTIQVNLQGGLGAGLALLNSSDRRRLVQQIAVELASITSLQGTMPLGYSGRGTI